MNNPMFNFPDHIDHIEASVYFDGVGGIMPDMREFTAIPTYVDPSRVWAKQVHHAFKLRLAETTLGGETGDWIVTNGEKRWVIKNADFHAWYTIVE